MASRSRSTDDDLTAGAPLARSPSPPQVKNALTRKGIPETKVRLRCVARPSKANEVSDEPALSCQLAAAPPPHSLALLIISAPPQDQVHDAKHSKWVPKEPGV